MGRKGERGGEEEGAEGEEREGKAEGKERGEGRGGYAYMYRHKGAGQVSQCGGEQEKREERGDIKLKNTSSTSSNEHSPCELCLFLPFAARLAVPAVPRQLPTSTLHKCTGKVPSSSEGPSQLQDIFEGFF